MSKKGRINKKLDEAIQKLVEQAGSDRLIRNETVAALKLAVQWEAVKARIKGDDGYGAALLAEGLGEEPPETGET